MIPKHKPYRNRRLLDLCHEIQECQVGIPGVCIGTSAHGCEPAHGPKSLLDGGGAMKSSDLPAAACHPCHVELDQGKRLSREERHVYWLIAQARTMLEFLRRGWIKVVPKSQRAGLS